ncbi:MAG: cell division protein ZapA [Firmicutes bacterium]|nr:cell division protein ZapA [Bacillota bacterium]
MADSNKVTVKIYGQEYTIAGSNSSDQIVIVANHVDSMMNELAKGASSLPASSLAVLTAVNITNDYFDAKDKIVELEGRITNLQKDSDHYIQLWEDAKASFKQYKEDAQNSVEQLQELQRIFNMKNIELNKASDTVEELTAKCADLEEKLEEQEKQAKANKKEESADADESLKKYKELENSFYDIQMENLHLKDELDTLKKSMMKDLD